MRDIGFLILFLQIVFIKSLNYVNRSANSYYFRNNGNNELKIYNRIHYLNHNISDYDYNYNYKKKPANIQVVKTNNDGTSIRTSVEKFFLDEEWDYNHKAMNQTDLPTFVHKFYERKVNNPSNMDTIRILFNTNSNSSSKIIHFNLDGLRKDENITDAEMYFYWPLENSSSIFKTSVVLRLYQFEDHSEKNFTQSEQENPDIHKLSNVIYISKAHKGWQTFKIKKPLDNWLKGEKNMGFLLTISSFDENKLISVYNDTNVGTFRTFAIFTVQKNASIIHNTTSNQEDLTSSVRQCYKRNWSVNLKSLHWDEFLIAPSTAFTAFDCVGRCDGLDKDHANHARILNVLGQRTSCCVPTMYSPLPMMFYDKFGNVVIKSYENMIVNECGCR